MPPTIVPTAPETIPAAQEDKSVTEAPKMISASARGKNWTIKQVVQTKGKGVGATHDYLDPNGDYFSFLTTLAEAVGKENLAKCIQKEVIQSACRDAEHNLEAKLKEGESYSPEQFLEEVFNQFLPGSRSGQDGIKIIREQLKQVMADIKPLMERYMKKESREKMSTEDINRLVNLQAEFGDLCEKEEKGSRKGKTEKKVTK